MYGLGSVKETCVFIQLADKSLIYLKGVLQDVLVKVKDHIFPTDFYVLDMGGNDISTIPSDLLIGRPFLSTGKTTGGNLTMEFDGEIVKSSISDVMKHPDDFSSFCSVDFVDPFV